MKATGALKRTAKLGDCEIRHVRFDYPTKGQVYIGLGPTATDAIEYAGKRLADPEEMDCCKTDTRVKSPEANRVRRLLGPRTRG